MGRRPWAALTRKVVAGYVSYAFHRAGEVTEGIAGIDDIMGFGFNWAPPSVLVDTIGARETIAMIEDAHVQLESAGDVVGFDARDRLAHEAEVALAEEKRASDAKAR